MVELSVETENPNPHTADRSPLDQASEATELAKLSFAAGDTVTGIAAITLAAQLVQLAKIQSRFE